MTTYSTSRETEPLRCGPHGECAPRGMTFLRRRGRVGSPPATVLRRCW
ncbi:MULTISPECIES: hypothetical protein [Streptomyces]|nr:MULTISPECIES: hypothetical protein [Streptomyces]QGY69374.1 hypothetical protein V519_028960 [Streptomyces rimosus R6-500]